MTLSDLATAVVRFGRERRAREADERLLAEAGFAGRLLAAEERITRVEEILREEAKNDDWGEP